MGVICGFRNPLDIYIPGYETVLQGGPQTNNMLKNYNRMLKSLVGAKTNVWDLAF